MHTSDIVGVEEMAGMGAAPPGAAPRMNDRVPFIEFGLAGAELEYIPIHIIQSPLIRSETTNRTGKQVAV